LPFVLGVAACVFAAVMIATLASGMTFRSVSRLYLGELEEGAKSARSNKEGIDLSSGTQGVVGSELEIIQSRTLVTKAILDSGLNVNIEVLGHKPPRYGQWLLSHRDAGSLDLAARALRADSAHLTDQNARFQRYTVKFSTPVDYEARRDDGRAV
jgi:uncharacterized protein involved in exopolysaccharide biosynthesis